jgi:hypothetical protein
LQNVAAYIRAVDVVLESIVAAKDDLLTRIMTDATRLLLLLHIIRHHQDQVISHYVYVLKANGHQSSVSIADETKIIPVDSGLYTYLNVKAVSAF